VDANNNQLDYYLQIVFAFIFGMEKVVQKIVFCFLSFSADFITTFVL